ncbi:MAG: hypothetical protein M1832_004987 [Thelocarpon impressellum]|nr:MAG: hypothetical protein M1832_004987 [Thelocarpon impressellum]
MQPSPTTAQDRESLIRRFSNPAVGSRGPRAASPPATEDSDDDVPPPSRQNLLLRRHLLLGPVTPIHGRRSPSPSDARYVDESGTSVWEATSRGDRPSSSHGIVGALAALRDAAANGSRTPRISPAAPLLPATTTTTPPSPSPSPDGWESPDAATSPAPAMAKMAKRRARVARRTPSSGGASRYIEYLECQLAASQARVKSLTSPMNATSQVNRLRAATLEAAKLRMVVDQWEGHLEERVQDAQTEQANANTLLKAKIRALERDAGLRAASIRELERELDESRRKASKAAALEAENAALGRRLDLLAELLAQAPPPPSRESAECQHQRDSPPPVMAKPRRRLGRPTSLMLRLSRASSSSSGSAVVGDQGDLQAAEGARRDALARLECAEQGPVSPSSDGETVFSPLSPFADLDQMPGTRPTSMASEVSSVFDPPLPRLASDVAAVRSPPTRWLRRFPSGSSGPKALILPTSTFVQPTTTLAPSAATSSGAPDRVDADDDEGGDEATPRPTWFGAGPSPPTSSPPSDRGCPASTGGSVRLGTVPGCPSSNGGSVRLGTVPGPRSLFTELALATGGKGTWSSRASSAGTSSLCQEPLLPVPGQAAEALWFGIPRSRRPPAFTTTSAVVISSARAIVAEMQRDPLRLAWRVAKAFGPKAVARLAWCLLGYLLGPAKGTDGDGERRGASTGSASVGDPRAVAPTAAGARRGPGHSLWMWLRFSAAMALACGVAVADGPASLFAAEAGAGEDAAEGQVA